MEPYALILVTLRETSPQRSLSNLCTTECFELLFGVEITPTIEDGVGSHILPASVWTEHIIFDILSPTIEDISQVVILNPMECLVFRGRHLRGEGFTYSEALALSNIYHWETTTGLAVESRCTASCTPYEMPEEILGWSGTKNVIRPSSAYGSSTRIMKRMVSSHQITEEGMCTAQTATSLRGFSRNNQNEGWEDAQQMQKIATAKARNKVMRAGMHSLAEIDLKVCIPIMRHQREPYKGTP